MRKAKLFSTLTKPTESMGSPLRCLYLGCGVLAAFFMVAIALLVLASIGARLLGLHLSGLADYAGYCMAASSFLALAYTFGHGGHIRVTLILGRFHGAARRWAELWCLGVAAFLAGYFAYFSIKMVRVSHLINDISQGPDATPLWIPQISMAVGTTVLAIAVVERFVAVWRGASPEDDSAGVVE